MHGQWAVMFSKLPKLLIFPTSGESYVDCSTGSAISFPSLWKSKRNLAKTKPNRLSDMQQAWQHDSTRTNCDNPLPAHPLAKSISEGENKLQVVMARGLLNQAINFSFVNALVRGKKKKTNKNTTLLLVLNFYHLQATGPDSSHSFASPCK